MAKPKPTPIKAQALPQALWHHPTDPETGLPVPAIGAMRYYRFYREVELSTLRWTPVDVHGSADDPRALPAHIDLSTWDASARAWRSVLHQKLPRLAKGKRHDLNLAGLRTSALKAVCLGHHPCGPSSYTQWGTPFNVPYAILNNVEFLGRTRSPWACDLPHQPDLHITRNHPKAPRGMTLLAEQDQVTFTGPRFAVGFSFRRPLMTHLGWDSGGGAGSGAGALKTTQNMLAHRVLWGWTHGDQRIASGPIWNTLDWDSHGRLWGGRVSVHGNVIEYRGLQLDPGMTVDARFEVRPDGMDLQLTQHLTTQRETLECEAWRFLWNGRTATVATLGLPRQDDGCRTGATALPAIWAAPGFGNLSVNQTSGDTARLQVDSWRAHEVGWSGIVLGHPAAYPHSFKPQPGTRRASLEFRVCDLGPNALRGRRLHPELKRNWGPGLMFRAELAGFSNNSFSTNCHLSQTGVTDLAAASARPKAGPPPIELARYTATMGLKRGRGYGDHRGLYQDSDPSLLNAAGRVQQVAPNPEWLEDLWPFVRATSERMLAKVDDSGLVKTALVSGNAGAWKWAVNGVDVVNFGHYDAWSNVETYRAFKNVEGLARAAGDLAYARKAAAVAAKHRAGFVRCFFNPKTGWFGSWRSRDGKLHDYCMTSINAPALLYGMVPRARAIAILKRIEAARLALNINNFRWGLPFSLIPIRPEDHYPGVVGWGFRQDGADAHGIYCNGMLTLGCAYYYIRAMSVFGFKRVAEQMAREILEGHALGRLVGGIGTGVEFHTFEGMACGYEGAYVLQFPALLAIAQNQGLARLPNPEFWLA